MTIRTNRAFERWWSGSTFPAGATDVRLHRKLSALVHSPLVRKEGSLVFADLWKRTTPREEFESQTDYEAFMNKFFVEDFLTPGEDSQRPELSLLVEQGVAAAFTLFARLSPMGAFRVFLSVDPDMKTASLRFLEARDAAPWGGEDPEEFVLEAVLMIDP